MVMVAEIAVASDGTPAGSATAMSPTPRRPSVRVSATRVGSSGWKRPAVAPPGAGTKTAVTSTTRCTVLDTWISAAPSTRAVIAVLATVVLAEKLRVEVAGSPVEAGKTVACPRLVDPVVVTVSAAAVASEGVAHRPATSSPIVSSARTGVRRETRVSSSRHGTTATSELGTPVSADAGVVETAVDGADLGDGSDGWAETVDAVTATVVATEATVATTSAIRARRTPERWVGR